jgi:hypothetical protein
LSQIGIFFVPKYWTLVSFTNQDYLEHARAISYSFQKDLFNSVLHAPLKTHFTLALKGFVVEGKFPF